jgi:hypothetical protein
MRQVAGLPSRVSGLSAVSLKSWPNRTGIDRSGEVASCYVMRSKAEKGLRYDCSGSATGPLRR